MQMNKDKADVKKKSVSDPAVWKKLTQAAPKSFFLKNYNFAIS